jgi:hypothetical protein
MKVNPIRDPLRGEQVVGVHPALQPQVDAGWRRRTHFHTGRSLSGATLTAEQDHRAGHLALAGQRISHGVVAGLEVDLERGDDGAFLHVGAGLGIAASGEDVMVPRALRIPLAELWVYVTPAPPPAPAPPGDEPDPADDRLPTSLLPASLLRPPAVPPPVLRGPFASLTEADGVIPRVGVLVLQPAELEERGAFDPTDPCEEQARDEAFSDRRRTDASRLVLFAWPWPALLPDPGPTWRNQIAYTVFGLEASQAPGQVHPWERVGVPLGLVGFDEAWDPLFIDANVVVRAGGKPRRRSQLIDGAGSAFLWQARIEQFAEHLAEVDAGTAPGEPFFDAFRFLPPAGLLPRSAVDLRERDNRAFPPAFRVEAVPVPIEQLDAALEPSAALEPFDLQRPDRVRILVPVPQPWYEPRLLVVEQADPAFAAAIDAFVARRRELLLRREDVRLTFSATLRAATGRRPDYPSPADDPDRLETELSEEDLDDFEARLRDPEGIGVEPPEADFGTRIVNGDRIAVPLRELRDELAAGPLVASELDRMEEEGLEAFIVYLDAKTRRANDYVDFGFLRIQSDMYRLRKLMVGDAAATRLATSPTLAAIIRSESALTVKEDLRRFLDDVRISRAEGQESTPTTTPFVPLSAGFSALTTAPPTLVRVTASAPESARAATSILTSPTSTVGGIGGGFTQPIGSIGIGGLGGGFIQPIGSIGIGGIGGGITQPIGSIVGLQPSFSTPTPTQVFAGPVTTIRPTPGLPQPARPADVFLKNPIVGESYDFRTVTVGERMETPPANEAKSFTVLSRFETIQGLSELEINLDDLLIPGFVRRAGGELDGAVEFRTLRRGNVEMRIPIREPKPLGTVKDQLVGWILEEDDFPDSDEASFFSVGVELLDATIAALRNVEGRVQQYRQVVDRCRETLERLRALGREADRRLKVIDDDLAEARHDVAVARALLVEEEERVEQINERRDSILRDHVRFLAFQRPRKVHARRDAPVRRVDPAFAGSPVPDCLADGVDPPAELRGMVELLREAPIRWFPRIPEILGALDRADLLLGTLQAARQRATVQGVPQVLEVPAKAGVGLLGQSIQRTLAAQQQVVATQRLAVARIDLASVAGGSWQLAREQAERVLSLGDLIHAPHGRTGVDRSATRELDQILRVATCLYGRFGEVLPRIRLEWAERLSQHDGPVNLRNLYALPRWDAVPYLDRREMQELVDWLFERVDPRVAEAVTLVNEVVRVCLLLASHAPVNQILAGSVPRQASVRPGGTLELAVDLSRVRIGMPVLLQDQQLGPVRGVVEDLAGGLAIMRVTQATGPTVTVAAGARVQFGAAVQPDAGPGSGIQPRTPTPSSLLRGGGR